MADKDDGENGKSHIPFIKPISTAVQELTIKALRDFTLIGEIQSGEQKGFDEVPAQHKGSIEEQRSSSSNDAFHNFEEDEEDEADEGVAGNDVSPEESENEEAEEADNDLVVLDPNHPLMERFQQTYYQHLLKQDEKITLQLKELTEEHSSNVKFHEDLGVDLYNVQQELARQQMVLEKYHNAYSEKAQLRKFLEAKLNETKVLYKQTLRETQQQEKREIELQSDVEMIASKILYVESAKDDIRSDITVLKRATEKTETVVVKAQREKKAQDFYVNKLFKAVQRLHEDILKFETQLSQQKVQTKAATQFVTEAATELEAIELEKKQLLQQWNNCLLAMRKRDEALNAMHEAYNLQNEYILAIDSELDGFKRQIKRAQEQNEQLTYMFHRIEHDSGSIRKQITISQNKQEALRIEYSTYSRTLHETEQLLNKAKSSVTIQERSLVNMCQTIEKEFQEKMKIEDAIMKRVQEQLTMDKASKYTSKMIEKIRTRAVQLQRLASEEENSISHEMLQIVNANTRLESLQETLAATNKVIAQKKETILKVENEIMKRNAIIEKKQCQVDQYNKRVESLVNKEGDEAFVGPLEFQIKTLQRQIEGKSHECLELQQYWLRQQGELVKVIESVSVQSEAVKTKKKESTILLQKKMRIEGELDSEINEIKEIQRSIRNMQNDMIKLNLLIHNNRDKQEVLQQDNVLLEHHFLTTLKEAELESVKIRDRIQGLVEEKERLQNALVEAERQIMLWEKKTQLAREAKDTVNSEAGQGEINSMKSELHRMEMRYTQLMRQQEKLVQEMESTVSKRESIIVRSDAKTKMDRRKCGRQQLSKGAFHKKMKELKSKIREVNKEATSYDEDILQYREIQQKLGRDLEENQKDVQALQLSADTKCDELQLMQERKVKNFNDIVTKQQRVKYLTSLKAGKYKCICKTPESLVAQMEKQNQKYQSLSTIVDRLNSEYPEVQPSLRRTSLLLSNRVSEERETEMTF